MASIDYFNIVAGVFSIASGVFAVGTYFRVAKYHRSLERAIVFPQLLDRLEANARNLQESARKRRSQGYLQSLELTRVCLRQVAPYLTD